MDLFKTLNNVQTHLLIWGDPFNCNGKDVIICISGNPGVPDFYTEFGSELHQRTGLPVCVIGQSGHEEVPDLQSNILKNQESLFNLEGQLKHKLDLIKNIDKESNLHLIGHSIGAWMITEIIHRDATLKKRISSVNLLFPTLQRMVETKSGFILNNILRRIHLLVMLVFTLVYILPEYLKIFFVQLYLRFHSLPKHYVERILKYLNPKVGEKVLLLAYDEMDRVGPLNVEAIDNIKHITYITYSTNDGWAPLHYMDDLKQFEPELKMKMVNIEHAFVLRSSEQVAEIVSEFIKTKDNK